MIEEQIIVSLIIIICALVSYKIGYHQGAVDKHKEIFDLIKEGMEY